MPCSAVISFVRSGGKPEGVVQPEDARAVERAAADVLEHFLQNAQPRVDGLAEALLLGADGLADVFETLRQRGIRAAVLLHDGVAQRIQEAAADAEQPSMAGGAAQHAAEDVAPPLVGGDDAVGNQKHGGADVVGDHAQRHVGRRGRAAVLHAGDLADLAHNVADGIHFEQVAHALHDRRQTLQPHAGVDVRVREAGVVAVPVAVELREHDVPDFDKAVAVAARTAVGLAASRIPVRGQSRFPSRGAGTRADLPEVVVLAELGNPLAPGRRS